MVAGVRRCKAGTHRTITYEDMDIIGKNGIVTGAKAENKAFYHIAADLVAQGGCYDQKEYPTPAFFAKVQGNEYQEKEVKRHPELRLA